MLALTVTCIHVMWLVRGWYGAASPSGPYIDFWTGNGDNFETESVTCISREDIGHVRTLVVLMTIIKLDRDRDASLSVILILSSKKKFPY